MKTERYIIEWMPQNCVEWFDFTAPFDSLQEAENRIIEEIKDDKEMGSSHAYRIIRETVEREVLG